MWGAGLGKGQAFDVGKASQTLVAELSRSAYAPRPGLSALVPGAGRAYDALALAQHGFESVTALDLAPTACEAAREELKASTGDKIAERCSVQCADFFEFTGGPYDLIWDCTFLCALDPSVRVRWAQKTASLLKPGGTLLTCVFPICDKVGGPPYAMSVDLFRSLLEPVGLEAVRVREDLSADEQHRPGGFQGSGGPSTALAVWAKPHHSGSEAK